MSGNNKLKKKLCCICCMLLVCSTMCVSERAQAYSLNQKVYDKVGNTWWTNNSSAGWDIKFKRSKMVFYSRDNHKVDWTARICKCKTLRKGYLICVKYKKHKYSYFISNKKNTKEMWHYSGWKKDPMKYSGSSSLSKGKWPI